MFCKETENQYFVGFRHTITKYNKYKNLRKKMEIYYNGKPST